MATTRNYTRDSTRKHLKYGGDDISSRIFEIRISKLYHSYFRHQYIIYIPSAPVIRRNITLSHDISLGLRPRTTGNISSNHPLSEYIND